MFACARSIFMPRTLFYLESTSRGCCVNTMREIEAGVSCCSIDFRRHVSVLAEAQTMLSSTDKKTASKTMSWFQGLSTGSLTTLHSSATCVISWFSCVEIWSAPGDYQLNFQWRCVEGALLCWRSIVRHWFSQGKHVSSFFRRENMSKAYFERQVILKRE